MEALRQRCCEHTQLLHQYQDGEWVPGTRGGGGLGGAGRLGLGERGWGMGIKIWGIRDVLNFEYVTVCSALLSVSGDSSARVTPVPTTGTQLKSKRNKKEWFVDDRLETVKLERVCETQSQCQAEKGYKTYVYSRNFQLRWIIVGAIFICPCSCSFPFLSFFLLFDSDHLLSLCVCVCAYLCVFDSLANLPSAGCPLPPLHPCRIHLVSQQRLVLPVPHGKGTSRPFLAWSAREEDLATTHTRGGGRENRVVE